MTTTFPKDFIWGVATSAYQIEGASLEDGRGECIWHRFSHTYGNVWENHNGDVACDHYHRYSDDIRLMQSLGVHAYRFSTSWPRVLSTGTGQPNPAGLDFYDRLVDELLVTGIEPFLTLYHWDLPQALQDQGGWANPASVQWFASYAELMAKRLGDRVKHWATHNEPWVIAFMGNHLGVHAPGIQDLPTALRVAHHLLLSHGAAVPVIRQHVTDAQVGLVLDQVFFQPASDDPQDVQAARVKDNTRNLWFLNPIFKGHYPAEAVAHYGNALDGIDLEAVKQAHLPLDFIGVNYYRRNFVGQQGLVDSPADAPHTAMGWEIYPQGLYEILTRAALEYVPPAIYITENGAAFDDAPPQNGVVEDPARVKYLQQHFEAAAKAIADGVPLKGYFVWSLLDNFEWAFGYDKRFGIVHVDFETLQRVPKRSALYLKEIIASSELGN